VLLNLLNSFLQFSPRSCCSDDLLMAVRLFLTVLWAPGSGLKCPRVDHKEITDCPC
jgi:hypothetical protein